MNEVDTGIEIPLERVGDKGKAARFSGKRVYVRDQVWRSLSARQREVLIGLILGQSNKAIAASLQIETVTVRLHLTAIFRKLGVANRTQAVAVAVATGQAADAGER